MQAQLALLDVVAVEVELPDSLHDATRRLVLHLSRPRVIGLASRGWLGGADLVASAASLLQELGAVVVDAPTDSSVESQLVQGAALLFWYNQWAATQLNISVMRCGPSVPNLRTVTRCACLPMPK